MAVRTTRPSGAVLPLAWASSTHAAAATETHTMPSSSLPRRQALRFGVAAASAALCPSAARTQPVWPSRAIRLVVPFAPGGSSEIVARATAAELGKLLGQSVYVENKPGAAGNVAMAEVARADDQHTLILGHIGTLAVNPFIFDKLPYDAKTAFKPLSLLSKVPSLYVVRPDLPAKNLQEFLALAKSKPGALNYGSAGNGSAGHLAFEYLKMASGIFVLHVPYRGTGPQLTDLMGGRLDAAAVGAPAVMQFIKTGKLRCIATGTTQRLPQLPDVPSVAEQGLPGFEMTQWYGLLAPASMPQPIADKLAVAAARAVKEPAAVALLESEAALVVGSSSAEFASFIEQEQRRWKPVIARAKIKPD
jgi:tripartite-type tricarboxylate transporter receptor subunit TctC